MPRSVRSRQVFVDGGPAAVPRLGRGVVLVLALAAVLPTVAMAQPFTFTHLAGANGGAGAIDGAGADARLRGPAGIAIDGIGTVYVADTKNHVIRKVTPTGVVTTLAGAPGTAGYADGAGSAARFSEPSGIAVDRSGVVYVADRLNSVIRKVSPAGVVTTVAGQAGQSGSLDGLGNAARFSQPRGITIDSLGTLYVGDTLNHTIRKITQSGRVTTLAGSAGVSGETDGTGASARFNRPMGIAVDDAGNVFVADNQNSVVRKVTPTGVVTTYAGDPGAFGSTNGTGTGARFNALTAVSVDGDGNVFVADTGNASIRKVAAGGVVTTLAGVSGNVGEVDGIGSASRFAYPEAIATAADGSLRVADTQNHTLRVVTAAAAVTTLAGFAPTPGTTDATGDAARFQAPRGVVGDAAGNIYVVDTLNHAIRKVTPAGVVTTFAGQPGQYGSADGTGSGARFFSPSGLAIDAGGNLYVADTSNHTIRKISPGAVVTTLAGLAGQFGTANGTGAAARFRFPSAVVVSGGALYVADRSNHAIRKVTAGGDVTTFAGQPGTLGYTDGVGTAARFRQPSGVTASNGIIYVADTSNRVIRAIAADGAVTTLAGVGGQQGTVDGVGAIARFVSPFALAAAGTSIYVVDDLAHVVRHVSTSGDVTTIAGSPGVPGGADGSGVAARFDTPSGIAILATGALIVSDRENHAIRRGVPTNGATATLTVTRAGTGQGSVESLPAGIACGADCSDTLPPGTLVSLTATAALGSVFTLSLIHI